MHNPLKRPILEILQNSNGVLKEYELHKLLGGKAFAQFLDDCSSELGLFRKHFLVMNALYELHEELLTQGLYLHISALEIYLQATPSSPANEQVLRVDTAFNKLSRYYRDWQNFNQADDRSVNSLLQQFWEQFLANEEKLQSLHCLELDSNANWPEIQRQYRRLCQNHHPDKGGESVHFIEIQQAYENLKYLHNRESH